MLYLALAAAGVFGAVKLFGQGAPSVAPPASAPRAWSYNPNLVAPKLPAPGPVDPMSLPPWKRNTNIFFGGDHTLATDISAFDPTTPGGRSNLGLFGWSDKLFSVTEWFT